MTDIILGILFICVLVLFRLSFSWVRIENEKAIIRGVLEGRMATNITIKFHWWNNYFDVDYFDYAGVHQNTTCTMGYRTGLDAERNILYWEAEPAEPPKPPIDEKPPDASFKEPEQNLPGELVGIPKNGKEKFMNNPVIWWELASHDAVKSVQFFKDVFGWEIALDESVGIYKLRQDPPTITGGGIFTLRRAKLPFLTLYIEVEDILAMAEKITQHGGFIVDPPVEIVPGTWICLFNEPSGVTFGMIHEDR